MRNKYSKNDIYLSCSLSLNSLAKMLFPQKLNSNDKTINKIILLFLKLIIKLNNMNNNNNNSMTALRKADQMRLFHSKVDVIDQIKLIDVWKQHNIPEFYQELFINYLKKAQKGQADLMIKQQIKSIKNSASDIQGFVRALGEKHKIEQFIKATVRKDNGKISEKSVSIICHYIVKLREFNYKASNFLERITTKYMQWLPKAKPPQKQLQFFNNFAISVDIFRKQHLQPYLSKLFLCQEDYDPFYMNLREEVQNGNSKVHSLFLDLSNLQIDQSYKYLKMKKVLYGWMPSKQRKDLIRDKRIFNNMQLSQINQCSSLEGPSLFKLNSSPLSHLQMPHYSQEASKAIRQQANVHSSYNHNKTRYNKIYDPKQLKSSHQPAKTIDSEYSSLLQNSKVHLRKVSEIGTIKKNKRSLKSQMEDHESSRTKEDKRHYYSVQKYQQEDHIEPKNLPRRLRTIFRNQRSYTETNTPTPSHLTLQNHFQIYKSDGSSLALRQNREKKNSSIKFQNTLLINISISPIPRPKDLNHRPQKDEQDSEKMKAFPNQVQQIYLLRSQAQIRQQQLQEASKRQSQKRKQEQRRIQWQKRRLQLQRKELQNKAQQFRRRELQMKSEELRSKQLQKKAEQLIKKQLQTKADDLKRRQQQLKAEQLHIRQLQIRAKELSNKELETKAEQVRNIQLQMKAEQLRNKQLQMKDRQLQIKAEELRSRQMQMRNQLQRRQGMEKKDPSLNSVKEQKKDIKLRVGKLTMQSLKQYLLSYKYHDDYLKLYDIKKLITFCQYNQTYLTQFIVNNQPAAIALSCLLSPKSTFAIKLWAISKHFDTSLSEILFNQYVEYIEKCIISEVIFFRGEHFRELSVSGFQLVKDHLYSRHRKTKARQIVSEFQEFIYCECSQINFIQSQPQDIFFSKELQPFQPQHSYAPDFLFTSNQTQIPYKLSNIIQMQENIPSVQKLNSILADNDMDGYEISKKSAIGNINLTKVIYQTEFKDVFVANDGFFKFYGSEIYKEGQKTIFSIKLSNNNGRICFGKGFKLIEEFSSLSISRKQQGKKLQFCLPMFSKNLYGRYILMGGERAYYGNWLISLVWEDQMQGVVKHNMKEGVQSLEDFYVSIELQNSQLFCFRVDAANYVY